MAKVYRARRKARDPATGRMGPATDSDGNPLYYERWSAVIVDHKGRRRTYSFGSDKRLAQKQADMLEAREREIRLGLRPPPDEPLAPKRPILDVMEEYMTWGGLKGGRGNRPWAADHARHKRAYLLRWIRALELKTLADAVDCLPRVEHHLAELAQDKHMLGSSLHSYTASLKSFLAWCSQRGRKYLAVNPLADFGGFDTTPLLIRRALTADDAARLIAAAPPPIGLLFETAICTGLRGHELRALDVCHLDVENAQLIVPAAVDKARRERRQPLPKRLAERLRLFTESGMAKKMYAARADRRGNGNPLLYVPRKVNDTLREIAAKAGIPIKTADGILNFHALRVTYVTLVVESGADVKTAQELARHSTPAMTMNVYAKTRQNRLTATAEQVGAAVTGNRQDKVGHAG